MSNSRRDFLKLTGAAGGALALGGLPGILGQAGGTPAQQTPPPKPPSTMFHYTPPNHGKAKKPLKILILGGTGFTGPFQVQYALSRGHQVSVFNRGKTRAGELPEGAEQLLGDRNGDYKSLMGRKWDVCIDIPTSIPVWVRDAAQVLKGNVDRYVFVSTVSVYAGTKDLNQDENAPLAQYQGPDAMKETQQTMAANMQLYGQLKVLSEREAEKWFPGKTLVVRPGLIVGPQDPSDRFTYWPLRVERGGEVLAPGKPDDPVQFIDARDLAEWTIRASENGTVGTFNGVGPKTRMGIGEMLAEMKKATKSKAEFTWVPADFLQEQNVSPWSDMPVWLPSGGEVGGMNTTSNKKIVAAGMTYRSVADTTKATLDWYHALPAERRNAKLRAGLAPEREVEVLAAWKAKNGSR
jgi:2'-hydroxyisoflavone reductase